MAPIGTLRHPQRYITTHDARTGKAVVETSITAAAPFYRLGPAVEFAHCFATGAFPAELGADADLGAYRGMLASPPPGLVGGGTVLRYVDMAPGHRGPMHRTRSLDYAVVVEGPVQLVLDSGDRRTLLRGDVCVQRATMHAWRNPSPDRWARVLFVLLPAAPFDVAGVPVEEDLGGMRGVRSSE